MRPEKTTKAYEIHLNALFADSFSLSQAEDHFQHIKVKKKTLIDAYNNQTLGTLLRKYDPIAFRTGYNDWRP